MSILKAHFHMNNALSSSASHVAADAVDGLPGRLSVVGGLHVRLGVVSGLHGRPGIVGPGGLPLAAFTSVWGAFLYLVLCLGDSSEYLVRHLGYFP